MTFRLITLAALSLCAATPVLAQDDFSMSPTVAGIYNCAGPDIGSNPPSFELLEDGAFKLGDKEGDFMMYDGVSAILQLASSGMAPLKLKRTGSEEYTYLKDGSDEELTQTVCKRAA